MNTEIKTMTATRNGKPVKMLVELKSNGSGSTWIRKADGTPFFGTTGYLGGKNADGSDHSGTIRTYRGRIICENVVFD